MAVEIVESRRSGNYPGREHNLVGGYAMAIVPCPSHQRRCTKCGDAILDNRFGSYCNPCSATYKRQRRQQGYYRKTSDKRRDMNYRSNYGLTLEDYNRMLEDQGGVCAICGKPETLLHHHGKLRPLGVDHNHETGQVRRLLCTACNTLVYTIESFPDRVERAVAYLESYFQDGNEPFH